MDDCGVHLPVRHPETAFLVVGEVQLRAVGGARLRYSMWDRRDILYSPISPKQRDRGSDQELVGEYGLHEHQRLQRDASPRIKRRDDVWARKMV